MLKSPILLLASNGMPSGNCISSIVSTFHCGNDQQWSIVSPDEVDGPGLMWYNDAPCKPDTEVLSVLAKIYNFKSSSRLF
jgi:hypothetical protein